MESVEYSTHGHVMVENSLWKHYLCYECHNGISPLFVSRLWRYSEVLLRRWWWWCCKGHILRFCRIVEEKVFLGDFPTGRVDGDHRIANLVGPGFHHFRNINVPINVIHSLKISHKLVWWFMKVLIWASKLKFKFFTVCKYCQRSFCSAFLYLRSDRYFWERPKEKGRVAGWILDFNKKCSKSEKEFQWQNF